MSTIKEVVKEKYGEAALRVVRGQGNGCCGASALDGCDPITSDLYDATEAGELPEKTVAASLGCGNPTALAELKAGETVLDLGSGGGIDVLLSATRVGRTGKAYGLDMTDEMLALAEENKRKSGVTNVEVLKGGSQLFSEFIATFGLLSVIWGCGRLRAEAVPFAVGLYITGAYWFTASTSFANPAVTLARAFTNTFAGIRPADAPGFMAAQLAGAFAATFLFRWLVPSLPKQAGDVVVPHTEKELSHGR